MMFESGRAGLRVLLRSAGVVGRERKATGRLCSCLERIQESVARIFAHCPWLRAVLLCCGLFLYKTARNSSACVCSYSLVDGSVWALRYALLQLALPAMRKAVQ